MFTVFNRTDGIPASPEPFRTREEAERFIREFRKSFFHNQGYYFTSRMERIAPDAIELEVVQYDEEEDLD